MKNIEIVFLADSKYFKFLNELIDSNLSFKKKKGTLVPNR
jgi:hypothetical protein